MANQLLGNYQVTSFNVHAAETDVCIQFNNRIKLILPTPAGETSQSSPGRKCSVPVLFAPYT
jgi:hypothetical protein